MTEDETSKIIVESTIEVHRELGGPGSLESRRKTLTQRPKGSRISRIISDAFALISISSMAGVELIDARRD
jgi:hypothetical protein